MLIALLALTVILELLLYTPIIWRMRIWLVGILCLVIPSSAVWLSFYDPSWLIIPLAIVSLCRIGNLLRIAERRMHEKHLYKATRRTTIYFCLAQSIVVALMFQPVTGITWLQGLRALALMQLVIVLSLASITYRTIWATRYRQGTNFYADAELPTLSVLIPARNETIELEDCLRSILLNDYPKLEIIVLDDCSQLRTADVIKSFAHDGVRFIKGAAPSSQWLAKNYAYEQLRDASSGEILMFCGVDTRLGPHTIRALVTELQARKKDMISVMPRRLSGELSSVFLQPIRYWWELSLPRKVLNRPAVLSTCWMIRADTLDKLGGFASNARSIIPERHFARSLATTGLYSFIRANDTLDVSTRKTFHEQQATAIRVKYPQLSKRPELLIGLVALELLFLLGPFIVLLYGLLADVLLITVLSGLSVGVLILTHTAIVYITNPPNSVVALWNFPLAVVSEIAVSVSSMIKYEFGEVIWKERNVCIPVMHVVPHLPKMPE